MEVMRNTRFLVVGATGHVGSKVAVLLANRGYDVTALVRREGARILDPYQGEIRYFVGDLTDEASIERAVAGMEWEAGETVVRGRAGSASYARAHLHSGNFARAGTGGCRARSRSESSASSRLRPSRSCGPRTTHPDWPSL